MLEPIRISRVTVPPRLIEKLRTVVTFVLLVGFNVGLALIVPNIIFIFFCRRRKAWSYAGALVLGVIAILLQVMITVQEGPNPLAGGPPVGVSALYITLPALICPKSYESILELRK